MTIKGDNDSSISLSADATGDDDSQGATRHNALYLRELDEQVQRLSFVSSERVLLGAIGEGNIELVRSLLLATKGLLTAKSNKEELTPLMLASRHGHDEIVRLLLLENAVDINEQTTYTWNQRSVQCQELFSELHMKTSNPIIRTIEDTALSLASRHGHALVVQRLLAHGAQVNVNSGMTALIRASEGGHVECVRLLLDNGADPCIRITDGGGLFPLSAAVIMGHSNVVAMLLEHDTSMVNATTAHKRFTPLRWAVICDCVVNGTMAPQRLTPLPWAVDTDRSECVALLLQHGADVNITDSGQHTSLWVATSWRNTPLQRLLLDHGAKVTPEVILKGAFWGEGVTRKRLWKNRSLPLPLPASTAEKNTKNQLQGV